MISERNFCRHASVDSVYRVYGKRDHRGWSPGEMRFTKRVYASTEYLSCARPRRANADRRIAAHRAGTISRDHPARQAHRQPGRYDYMLRFLYFNINNKHIILILQFNDRHILIPVRQVSQFARVPAFPATSAMWNAASGRLICHRVAHREFRLLPP